MKSSTRQRLAFASFLACSFLAPAASAQYGTTVDLDEPAFESDPESDRVPTRRSGGLHIGAGVGVIGPMGIPEGNLSGVGPAFDLSVGYALPDWFRFGVQLGYGRLGTRDLVHPEPAAELVARSGVWTAHAYGRLQPRSWPVQPYLEGLVGFKYFSAEVEERLLTAEDTTCDWTGYCETTEYWDEYDIYEQDDVSWSAGLGAGVDFRLIGDDDGFALTLGLGVRYLAGGNVTHVVDVEQERDGTVVVETQEATSDTVMGTVSLGVQF